MSESIRTKIGPNHGKPRTRVWLEGARLQAAGFAVGERYDRKVEADRITITLDSRGYYKVSGKGVKPIIDTTGTKLFTAFPGDHAAVAIQPGRITISAEVLP